MTCKLFSNENIRKNGVLEWTNKYKKFIFKGIIYFKNEHINYRTPLCDCEMSLEPSSKMISL